MKMGLSMILGLGSWLNLVIKIIIISWIVKNHSLSIQISSLNINNSSLSITSNSLNTRLNSRSINHNSNSYNISSSNGKWIIKIYRLNLLVLLKLKLIPIKIVNSQLNLSG